MFKLFHLVNSLLSGFSRGVYFRPKFPSFFAFYFESTFNWNYHVNLLNNQVIKKIMSKSSIGVATIKKTISATISDSISNLTSSYNTKPLEVMEHSGKNFSIMGNTAASSNSLQEAISINAFLNLGHV